MGSLSQFRAMRLQRSKIAATTYVELSTYRVSYLVHSNDIV